MPMNNSYLNALASQGASLITHIGLVNGSGVELSSGSYARQPVTWSAPSNGDIAPVSNLVFNITAGDVVAGWRGYSALTGGTDYGGATVTTRTYTNNGTYTLQAASTSINHDAA